MEEKKLNQLLLSAWNGLSDGQKKRVKECKNMNGQITLLCEMGVAMPDELLDSVSGGTPRPNPGKVTYTAVCPICNQPYTYTKEWAFPPDPNISAPIPHPNCAPDR
ncbi:MAG: hypothetical protein IJS45_06740 [Clostridia bacterium]|nr:hypothetical protein [Clostridia bacterium]